MQSTRKVAVETGRFPVDWIMASSHSSSSRTSPYADYNAFTDTEADNTALFSACITGSFIQEKINFITTNWDLLKIITF